METIFEPILIILAVAVCILCSLKFSNTRRKGEKVVCVLGVVAAVLLIFNQSLWWNLHLFYGQEIQMMPGSWTAFNVVTMTAFILLGWPRRS